MKKMILASMALTLMVSCSSSEPSTPSETGGEGGSSSETSVNITSNLSVDLSTDKVRYTPGQTIRFKASQVAAGAQIRYRNGSDVVATMPMSSAEWTWTAPSADNTGYIVDIFTKDGDNETILGTIGVDVSSDWTTFPRYGFVATFDPSKETPGAIESEMDYLSRCHINAVQFQDWHNKHHWPLGGTRNQLIDVYKDIAMRDVSTAVVKKYISVQHGYGMKSIFYNLAFGALDDAASDGVKEEWYLFKDRNHRNKDYHGLKHMGWKSDIFLVNPGNAAWQAYLAQRNDDVYANFDFDGYQIDQLGYRGDLYDYNGNKVNLPDGYASFISAMKAAHPDKTLIMNAVSSYGASQIAGSGNVGFCYNEVWDSEPEFNDLYNIIKANEQYSGGRLKTVFAAYMNYNKAGNSTGYFNTPGVLMADAVMFALGGSHLELGDHMLCREYFPSTALSMNQELRASIIRYYDFMTAYQHKLRGGNAGTEYQAQITPVNESKNVRMLSWPAKKGYVATYARKSADAETIHLLNFVNIDNLNWCDTNGERPAPRQINNLQLRIKTDRAVKKVWVASPDVHGGVPVELSFTRNGNDLNITVPTLKYWSMIVIE